MVLTLFAVILAFLFLPLKHVGMYLAIKLHQNTDINLLALMLCSFEQCMDMNHVKKKYVTCVPEAHGQHDEFFPELLLC